MRGCWCFLLSAVFVSCSRTPEVLEQDFTVARELDEYLMLVGESPMERVRWGNEGLHIVMPPGRKPRQEAGIGLASRLLGDFSVELDYQITDVSTPKSGFGEGIKIWVRLATQPPQAMTLAHVRRSGGMNHFVGLFAPFGPGGGGKGVQTASLPLEHGVRSGRLKLVRQDGQIHFLASTGGDEGYQEVLSVPAAEAPVRDVRIITNSGRGGGLLDVRLLKVRIEADDITERHPGAGTFRVWLGVWAVVLVMIVLGGILEWRNGRRRVSADKTANATERVPP